MENRLTAPIIQKQKDLRVVAGPVLVPGERDHDDDVVSKEKVQAVAHDYLENYRIVDVDHKIEKAATPVESWLTMEEKELTAVDGFTVKLPAGTWMLATKVYSDEAWQRVLKGELSGFSIMAVKSDMAEKAKKNDILKVGPKAKEGVISFKSLMPVTLSEMENEFVVPAVSLVENPAVPKSKYVAIKSKKAETGEDSKMPGWFKRFLSNFKSQKEGEGKSAKKESRILSAENYELLSEAFSMLRDAEEQINKLLKKEDRRQVLKNYQIKEGKIMSDEGKEVKIEDLLHDIKASVKSLQEDLETAENAGGDGSADDGEDGEDGGGDSTTAEELETRIDELEAQLGTEPDEDGDDDGDGDDDDEGAGISVKEVATKLAKLEKMVIGSKGITGQDDDDNDDDDVGDDEDLMGAMGRNSFGIKKK